MSLKPWFPVPMIPRLIRSLGATLPPSPRAEPGMIVGKAIPAAATWAVLRRKVRREGLWGVDRGGFIGVARGSGLEGCAAARTNLGPPRHSQAARMRDPPG